MDQWKNSLESLRLSPKHASIWRTPEAVKKVSQTQYLNSMTGNMRFMTGATLTEDTKDLPSLAI
jgi:hypothetical protein